MYQEIIRFLLEEVGNPERALAMALARVTLLCSRG